LLLLFSTITTLISLLLMAMASIRVLVLLRVLAEYASILFVLTLVLLVLGWGVTCTIDERSRAGGSFHGLRLLMGVMAV